MPVCKKETKRICIFHRSGLKNEFPIYSTSDIYRRDSSVNLKVFEINVKKLANTHTIFSPCSFKVFHSARLSFKKSTIFFDLLLFSSSNSFGLYRCHLDWNASNMFETRCVSAAKLFFIVSICCFMIVRWLSNISLKFSQSDSALLILSTFSFVQFDKTFCFFTISATIRSICKENDFIVAGAKVD